MATMLWRGRVFLSLFVLGAKAQDMIPLAAAGMRQSFSEAFYATLPWCSKRCQGERWRTKYDHSAGTPLSRNLGMSGSEGETFMDPAYLGLGVNSFDIDPGTLSLLIGPVSEAAMVGGKKVAPQFTAGTLSTERSLCLCEIPLDRPENRHADA
jgi:hypothetical protein